MRELYDSDNLGGDLSDLGAPRKKHSQMQPGRHPRTKVMAMAGYYGYLGAAKTAAQKKAEADAKKAAAAAKKETRTEAVAAKKSAAEVVQAQRKETQAAKVATRQQATVQRKEVAQAKQVATKQAQATKKAAAQVVKATKQEAAATKKTERAQDKAAKLEAKKALRLKNGKTVNLPASEVPKVQAIEAAGEKLKADLPNALKKLQDNKAKIADLKAKIAAKGKTPVVKKPTGALLAVKKPVAPVKRVMPAKSIMTKKGLGWLAYLGAAQVVPAGATVDVTPVQPKGYAQRKAKGNLKVQDQVYELSIYSQQQLGAVADQMQAMQDQFDQVMQQIADSETEIQSLMDQLANQPAGGTGIDPNTGYPYGIDPATGLPYATGVDQTGGLVDTSMTDGGSGDMVPGIPINDDGTGDTGSGLEVSPAMEDQTGGGVSPDTGMDQLYQQAAAEEGTGTGSMVTDSGAITPSDSGYQQTMPDQGGYTDESAMLPSGAGQEDLDFGAGQGEILSPTQTMVPPMPPSPVVEPLNVPPVPVQQADEEVMFPTPVTSETAQESGTEVYEQPSTQEELMPESGAEETFDTAPVMAPAAMTEEEETPRKRRGGSGGPRGADAEISELAPVGEEGDEGFAF